MGMPTVGVYVLLATLVAPALVKIGLSPMAAHMFVIYFGMMSMITPPVALAAFAAASLAQTDPMKTGWTAVRFGWIAFIIPFLFVRAPSLLLEGSLSSVLMALVTALAGVWLICAAFAGYAVRLLSTPMRVGFAVAGAAAVHPRRVHAARRMDRHCGFSAGCGAAGARSDGHEAAAADCLTRGVIGTATGKLLATALNSGSPRLFPSARRSNCTVARRN